MHETILIVEDHKETCDMIQAAIADKGMCMVCTGTLADALELLKRHKPALIILDLGLPDGDGLDLCRTVRANPRLSRTPIIALTGRAELCAKKLGFEAGVDQYLEKPISPEELSLWTGALLRRTEWANNSSHFQTFGDLKISKESYELKFGGITIGNLTRREFDLFSFLVNSAPRPISRKGIITEVWKTVSVENLVDTHIYNLRRKLPKQLAIRIQSIPGRGFRYRPCS